MLRSVVGDYLLGEKQSARIHLINLAVVLSQLALWALQYADHRSSWRLGLLIHWGALTPWSLLMFTIKPDEESGRIRDRLGTTIDACGESEQPGIASSPSSHPITSLL